MIRGFGFFLAALALAGCGGKSGREAASAVSARRIVCATPAVAEIVFALGQGARVVGVSEFTDWPPEAAAKPAVEQKAEAKPEAAKPAAKPAKVKKAKKAGPI